MLAAIRTGAPAHRLIFVRCLTTESLSSASTHSEPPPPPPPSPSSSSSPSQFNKSKPRLYPRPRPPISTRNPPLPKLPPTFGRNQLLSVADSTRALLESIVSKFNAPIRYAFAYGSGVFEQEGYDLDLSNIAKGDVEAGKGEGKQGKEIPMLDFMFAVTHPAHFHYINMQQYPSHYPLHARMLGSSYVERVEDIGPGVWFNAYVPMNGVMIKYGVTGIDNLCSDLLNWRTLYLAGRMHKPIRIIKDDARVRLTQQVNLTSAVRTALLTLPERFSETQLFETIAAISYNGDPRMLLPAENRGKVGNIVRKQGPQFKELYQRLVVGLPGTHWPVGGKRLIEQDTSARGRSFHLKKLPSNLLNRVRMRFVQEQEEVGEDESAYWMKLAAEEEKMQRVIMEESARIVRGPATVQTLKGVVTTGIGKSLRYGTAKVGKWWAGS